MHKKDLVKKLAETTSLTQAQAEEAVTATLNLVMDTVAAREKVTLTGFGTLESRTRKGRMGRHPKTGADIKIPEKQVVKFTIGKSFKETVANG